MFRLLGAHKRAATLGRFAQRVDFAWCSLRAAPPQPSHHSRRCRSVGRRAMGTVEEAPRVITELVSQSFGGNVLERSVASRRDAVRAQPAPCLVSLLCCVSAGTLRRRWEDCRS